MTNQLRDDQGHFITTKNPSPGKGIINTLFVTAAACLLVLAFHLGRLQVLGRSLPTSKVGILKITNTNNSERYLLLEKSGKVINLSIPKTDLSVFQNRRVVVTGIFNEAQGTLTVNDQGIEKFSVVSTADLL